MLPLNILALEPLNGFAISQRLKRVPGDIPQVSDGSPYPALHKLEQEGGFPASGNRGRTIAEQNSIRSRGWAEDSLKLRTDGPLATIVPAIRGVLDLARASIRRCREAPLANDC
jgi:Transcriptional regulator PadR-like family